MGVTSHYITFVATWAGFVFWHPTAQTDSPPPGKGDTG